MRKLIIPITEDTVEMLAEINGGVKPECEEEPTFFVYNGPDVPAEIIDQQTALAFRWDNSLLMYIHFKK